MAPPRRSRSCRSSVMPHKICVVDANPPIACPTNRQLQKRSRQHLCYVAKAHRFCVSASGGRRSLRTPWEKRRGYRANPDLWSPSSASVSFSMDYQGLPDRPSKGTFTRRAGGEGGGPAWWCFCAGGWLGMSAPNISDAELESISATA